MGIKLEIFMHFSQNVFTIMNIHCAKIIEISLISGISIDEDQTEPQCTLYIKRHLHRRTSYTKHQNQKERTVKNLILLIKRSINIHIALN